MNKILEWFKSLFDSKQVGYQPHWMKEQNKREKKEIMLIKKFTQRLNKIGITVSLSSNYPWIYLLTINDIPVTEKYRSEFGFTAFFNLKKEVFSNRRVVFKLIRKYRDK